MLQISKIILVVKDPQITENLHECCRHEHDLHKGPSSHFRISKQTRHNNSTFRAFNSLSQISSHPAQWHCFGGAPAGWKVDDLASFDRRHNLYCFARGRVEEFHKCEGSSMPLKAWNAEKACRDGLEVSACLKDVICSAHLGQVPPGCGSPLRAVIGSRNDLKCLQLPLNHVVGRQIDSSQSSAQ
jgi:hypothetical protein